LAEAAAAVVLQTEPLKPVSRVLELNAGASYSFFDVASVLSELAGRPIAYVDIPLETMASELAAAQTSPLEVELMVGIARSIQNSEADHPRPELGQILGRPPIDLRESLRRAYEGKT
jgi:NAD(P)H dehydrogenase (quinone)